MNRFLIIVLALGALLVATNPSRTDLNGWAQSYVANHTANQGQLNESGTFGAVLAGLAIAALPIERQNFLLFSIYTLHDPSDQNGQICSIIGIGGQFVPLVGCDQLGSSARQALPDARDTHAEAQAALQRGLKLGERGEYKREIEELDAALKLKPDYVEALNNRCVAHKEMREFDQAISDCSEAIQLNPNYAFAYFNRALSYLERRTGDGDRARQDLDQAIRLKPDFAEAYCERGQLEYLSDLLALALSDENQAVALRPSFARALYFRGLILFEQGDVGHDNNAHDRALDDLDAAVRMDPASGLYASAACAARATTGRRLETGVETCNVAIRLDQVIQTANDRNRESLALVLLRLGRYEEATTECDKVLVIEPKSGSCLLTRGIAKLRHGDQPGGESDIAAARSVDATIVSRFASFGVVP